MPSAGAHDRIRRHLACNAVHPSWIPPSRLFSSLGSEFNWSLANFTRCPTIRRWVIRVSLYLTPQGAIYLLPGRLSHDYRVVIHPGQRGEKLG